MVGHQQDTGSNMSQLRLELDTQRRKQRRRPAGPEAQARCIVQERQENERKNEPADQQQDQLNNAKQAE